MEMAALLEMMWRGSSLCPSSQAQNSKQVSFCHCFLISVALSLFFQWSVSIYFICSLFHELYSSERVLFGSRNIWYLHHVLVVWLAMWSFLTHLLWFLLLCVFPVYMPFLNPKDWKLERKKEACFFILLIICCFVYLKYSWMVWSECVSSSER